MTKRKGFTLVELLVAVGIIGVLASITAVSVGNARAKARDSRRVADIKTVQNSLEIHFNDSEVYPTLAQTALTAHHLCNDGIKASATACGTSEYLKIPVNPTPNGTDYTYTSANGSTYTLTFTLENAVGGLAAGLRTATPTGIQ